MLLTLLSFLITAQGTPTAVEASETAHQPAIAVLRSGLRVEASSPQVGDATLQTPLGRFSIPMDPVVEVVDGRAQLLGFRRLRQLDLIDDVDLLNDLSTAGQLTEMVRVAQEVRARDSNHLLPYQLLEQWARGLDPVPEKIDREDRVEWLWKAAQGDDFVASVIAGQRLVEEVVPSLSAGHRQLSIRELRHGLESESDRVRRSAARAAGAQMTNDIPLLLELGRQSLSDLSGPAREGAAWAANQIHPQFAFSIWVAVLCRGGETALRLAAAEGLGRYSGESGVRALFLVLASTQHRAPNRFEYAGRKIWVVTGSLGNVAELKYLKKWGFLMPSPDGKPLEDGSVFQVTTVDSQLEEALVEVLTRTGTLDGPRPAETPLTTKSWLDWYEKAYREENP